MGDVEESMLSLTSEEEAQEWRDYLDSRPAGPYLHPLVKEICFRAGVYDTAKQIEVNDRFLNLSRSMNYAEVEAIFSPKSKKSRVSDDQTDFGVGESIKTTNAPPITTWQRLKDEEDAIGFDLSGRRMQMILDANEVKAHRMIIMENAFEGQKITVVGRVDKTKVIYDRNHKMMAFFDMSDSGITLNCVVFSQQYAFMAGVEAGRYVVASGTLNRRQARDDSGAGSLSLIIESIKVLVDREPVEREEI